MKKLLTILLLIFIFAGSASGQWIWQQKPMLGQQIDRLHQLGDPVGFWLFNEGSGNKVFDLSGNRNTGTLIADTHFVSGKFGSALDFDGTGDLIDLDARDWAGESQISVCAWIKGTNAVPTETHHIITQGNSGDRRVFRFYWDGGQNVVFEVWNSAASMFTGQFTDGITDTNWHQVCGVLNSDGSVIVYVDTVKGGTIGSFSGTLEDGISAGQDKLHIGARRASGGGLTGQFNGKIDHVMIYDTAKTASEIAQLYREPFGMFEQDDIAMLEAGVPVAGVVVTPYYYRGFIPLPFIFFTVYYLRRRKCAA